MCVTANLPSGRCGDLIFDWTLLLAFAYCQIVAAHL